MIWFACKQCGKTHGRGESSIGATIFCECGQGLMVPWESTAGEPPPPPPPVAVPHMPPPLKLEPVSFDPEPPRPGPPPSRSRQRVRAGPRDPNLCLNHDTVPKQAACADCGESFCPACLVDFQRDRLCGPCKNYRVRVMQRPLPAPPLALVSLGVSLVMGPLTFCLVPIGRSPGFPWWSLLAMGPQVVALMLGILAIRQVETDPRTGGRALAFTGTLTAAVTAVLILMLTLYSPRIWS